MDVVAELENMASIAVNRLKELDPDSEEITRWQKLFGYDFSEAEDPIRRQRQDLSHNAVSDEHWQLVRAERETEGFSKEAYEHSIAACTTLRGVPEDLSYKSKVTPPLKITYLLRLEGRLDKAMTVQEVLGTSTAPQVFKGVSEHREASFCLLDGFAKHTLEQWLLRESIQVKPTFIRINLAGKDLSPDSIHPTVGKDATMPQFRIQTFRDPVSAASIEGSRNPNSAPFPLQTDYPLWYFFYGTLANPDILSQVLSLPEADEPPVLIPANVSGAALTSWNEKYRALVDEPPNSTVSGVAFKISSEEQECALRRYETEAYEVVRCNIQTTETQLRGLTFRSVKRFQYCDS